MELANEFAMAALVGILIGAVFGLPEFMIMGILVLIVSIIELWLKGKDLH